MNGNSNMSSFNNNNAMLSNQLKQYVTTSAKHHDSSQFHQPSQKQLEKIYNRIFNEEEQQLTEEGITLLQESGIQLNDLLNRKLEEFESSAPSQDIAKIRFDHYHLRRKKKLIKIKQLIWKKENYQQSNEYLYEHPIKMNNTINEIVNFNNTSYIPARNKLLNNSSNFIVKRKWLDQQNISTALGTANAFQTQTMGSASQSPGMQNFGRATFHIKSKPSMTNRSMQDTFFEKRMKSIIVQKALERESVSKFMKVRENAEKEAKKKIDKLNVLMNKRVQKERKVDQKVKENSQDIISKLKRFQDKRNIAKDKTEKFKMDQQNKSYKIFADNLKELEERQLTFRKKEKDRSSLEFKRHQNNQKVFTTQGCGEESLLYTTDEEYGNKNSYRGNESNFQSLNRTRMNQLSKQHSLSSYKRKLEQYKDDYQVVNQMKQFEDKMQKGLERSLLYKQELSQKAALEVEKVRRINYPEMVEQENFQRWSSYVQKRYRLEQKMKKQRNLQVEKFQMSRQTFQSRYQKQQEVRKGMLKDLEEKFKEYQKRMISSEKQLNENKRKIHLEKLKKDELQHLRRIDQMDNLEEQNNQRQIAKEKILSKHDNISMQYQSLKDQMKFIEDLRLRQQEEKRKFMEKRVESKPYDEMKYRFMDSISMTPDLADFISKQKKKIGSGGIYSHNKEKQQLL